MNGWTMLMRSIIKAACILGMDYTEKDLPSYGEWEAARRLHKQLWTKVKTRRNRE